VAAAARMYWGFGGLRVEVRMCRGGEGKEVDEQTKNQESANK